MRFRHSSFAILLFAATVAAAGCQRNIVRAAPPSVAAPPPPGPMPQPTAPSAPTETAAEEPPAVTPATTAAPPAVRPVEPRPRPPVETEAAKPKADPPPATEPPQIAPALSPQQLAGAQRRTQSDIVVAERNLQLVNGKRLNTTQNDLTEKIRDFLGQAHEAILTSDWVRAENLAHKAQILSGELAKSF